jgi:hypothetical protein
MSLALPSSAVLKYLISDVQVRSGFIRPPLNDEATRKELLSRSLEALFLARNVLIGPRLEGTSASEICGEGVGGTCMHCSDPYLNILFFAQKE